MEKISEPKPGWLRRQLEAAERDISTWPEWMRRTYPTIPREDNLIWTCVHRRACHEAQTCASKPCRRRRLNDPTHNVEDR